MPSKSAAWVIRDRPRWPTGIACLNAGNRLPLVGASGKDRNTVALGSVRTYARLEPNQEFRYGAWIEAVRAGRTFVTDGPLLSLTVNGRDPGSVLSNAGQTVRIQAEACSVTPFDRLECVYNGAVVASTEASGDPRTATLEADVSFTGSGWLAARCLEGGDGSAVRAHTSPVYVRIEDRPMRPHAETMAPLLAVLDAALTWVDTESRCANDRQREQLKETLRTARQELSRRGEV